MKQFSFLLAILFYAFTAEAKHLTSTEALGKVFSDSHHKVKAKGSLHQYQHILSTDAFYAFNNTSGGFIILAADDCVENLVLGYSDVGSLNPSAMPQGMVGLLENLNEEVKILADINNRFTNRASDSLEKLDEIKPLTESHWNQNDPYNLLAPEHYNAGCVATAMAQLMYYHKWPLQGKGSHSYSWIIDTSSDTNYTLSSDFSKSIYDWENMLSSYNENSTEAQRNAVAKLLLDCGVSVETWYRSGTSLGYTDKVCTSLIDYFNYDPSMSFVHRNYYTKREWRDLLYNSLSKGLPVYYRGKTQSGDGHAFICDGYKDGLFHINWGWGGMSDGYFQIALLDPAEQGLGGSTSGYQCEQKALLGVRPYDEGKASHIMYCTKAFYSAQNKSTTTKQATFYGTFESETCVSANYTLGIRVEDGEGKSQIATTTFNPNHTFRHGGTLNRITISMADLYLPAGTYRLTPVFRSEDSGQWDVIRVIRTQQERSLLMTVDENGNIVFSTPEENAHLQVTEVSPKWHCIAGYETDVNFCVTTTLGDYLNDVYIAFLEKGSNTICKKSSKIFIDVTEGEELSYTASIQNPPTAGEYDMVLLDANGNIAGERTPVTVEDAPATPLAVSGTISCKGTSVDALRFNVNLKCSGGVFCSKITIWIYDTSNKGYGSLVSQDKAFLVEGDNQTVTISGALNNLKPSTTYNAHAYYMDDSGNWQWICQVRFRATSATGIDDVLSVEPDNCIYNIMGQKINDNLPKGICIKAGKKFFVK